MEHGGTAQAEVCILWVKEVELGVPQAKGTQGAHRESTREESAAEISRYVTVWACVWGNNTQKELSHNCWGTEARIVCVPSSQSHWVECTEGKVRPPLKAVLVQPESFKSKPERIQLLPGNLTVSGTKLRKTKAATIPSIQDEIHTCSVSDESMQRICRGRKIKLYFPYAGKYDVQKGTVP